MLGWYYRRAALEYSVYDDDWMCVWIESQKGYAERQYLSTDPSPEFALPTYVTTSRTFKAYYGPMLEKSTDNWWRVQIGSHVGYMSSKLLSSSPDAWDEMPQYVSTGEWGLRESTNQFSPCETRAARETVLLMGYNYTWWHVAVTAAVGTIIATGFVPANAAFLQAIHAD